MKITSIYTILLVALSTLAISCTPKAAKTSTSGDANAAYETFVNKYNAQALAEGKSLMESNCNKCHKLKPADKHAVAKWDRILDRMIPKAKLNTEDGNKVRAYIYSVALQ